MFKTIEVKTNEKVEMIEITENIREIVKNSGVKEGFCYLFVPHSTAAITINENFVVDVLDDIKNKMNELIQIEDYFVHYESEEVHGKPDVQYSNSDAHIKTSLFSSAVNIIIENSEIVIGQYQGIYYCEWDGPRNRKLHIKISNVPNI